MATTPAMLGAIWPFSLGGGNVLFHSGGFPSHLDGRWKQLCRGGSGTLFPLPASDPLPGLFVAAKVGGSGTPMLGMEPDDSYVPDSFSDRMGPLSKILGSGLVENLTAGLGRKKMILSNPFPVSLSGREFGPGG